MLINLNIDVYVRQRNKKISSVHVIITVVFRIVDDVEKSFINVDIY